MRRATPAPPLAVHAALFVAAVCLGGLAVAGKTALREIPPGLLALLRSAGAALVLQAVARARGFRRVPGGRTTWKRLAQCAVFGVVLNQLFFLHGLRLTTATAASILVCSIPVFTAVFAALAGHERLGLHRAGGIALALAGVLTLLDVAPGALASGGASTAGNLMIVINAAGYSVYLLLLRPLGGRMPAIAITGWVYTLGAAIVLPFGLYDLARSGLGGVSPAAWWSVAYVILGGTVIPYSLIVWGLPASGPTLAALYTYIQPLSTAALAAWLLSERPGLRDILAALLIGGGVWLASIRRR